MHADNLLTDRARLTPQREALTDLHTGLRYTYDALNRRANRAANFVITLGINSGDRVLFCASGGGLAMAVPSSAGCRTLLYD